MKRGLTLFFLCYGLFFSTCSHAQGWIWDWASGGTGGSEGWAVCTDPWGNVFGLGYPYGSSVQFGSITLTGFGGQAAIVVKYDASGNLVWAHSTQNGNARPVGISADAAGNLYLLGTYSAPTMHIGASTLTCPATQTGAVFLAKFSPSGAVDWAMNVACGTAFFYGGISTSGTDVYVTSSFSDAVLAVGSYTLTNVDATGMTSDILAAKIDGAGNVIWAKSAGGSGNDYPYGIAATQSSNTYITGTFSSPAITFGGSTLTNSTSGSIFLLKYDATGTPLWGKSAGNGNEIAYSVTTDAAEDAYVVGYFSNETLSFGTYSFTASAMANNIFLAKYTSSGSVGWAKEVTGTNTLEGYGVAVDACSNVWISGSMGYGTGNVNIDGNLLAIPGGSTDPMFIAGYTAGGTYITSSALTSGGDDMNGICTDGVGNVFIGGDFEGTTFSVGASTLTATGGEENLFVAKYGITGQRDTATSSIVTSCLSQPLQGPPGYKYYLWSDGSTDSARTVDSAGTYWVQATGSCNSPVTVYSFTVTNGGECDCNKVLFVPNAFTPNGDGQDDVFYPRCGSGISQIKSFRVYDRWGEVLFERENLLPNDANNAWDGNYKGEKPKPDVFIWTVDAVCEDGKVFSKKGNVTLIR